MIKKDNKLNQWLWKWHFIAGLISLPFVVLLAVTGGVYLFKDTYDAPRQAHIKSIEANGNPITYQEQWDMVKANLKKQPNSMVVPANNNEATEFVSGMFSHKNSVFVNPYSKKITGSIGPQDSNMYAVRKLHGELLMGSFGTKIVELVASWLIVLILTGIYVFWPAKKQGIKGFFTVRFKQGKRILFRDLHTVFGFWISILLLMTLAGGLPWTDVFGGNFQALQNMTNTGYPKTWDGKGIVSQVSGKPLPLDSVVAIGKKLNLEGKLNVGLPQNETGVFIVYNETFDLDAQKRFYIDQYSGKPIMKHNWSDVGILMRARMWFMAFHQGQFGTWNLLLMLCVSILLTFVALSALVSYLKRKQVGDWGVPKVPKKFKVSYGIIAMIVILGICFPLFGMSVLLIVLMESLALKNKAL
ncbi:PepSY domain-containing protein [Flavobacteriaceae bacterium XHP0103]|uniref:PepSY-associated TM helix domain-containing protein n=1 Tax=Marixanthotalea marina TaxID=2844359 RepID=UPI002989FBB3|nr:PepSY domain-containing protein [Marixanthotalea marina]MBU3822946.1 PepSY domain-containing protein [Marixanthotalea marina]